MAAVAAGKDDAIFIFESVVHGHHIHKKVWTPTIVEILGLAQEMT